MPRRKKIVLASTSPRRIELLRQIGLKCEVIAPLADETPRKNEKPAALVARLARAKAQAVAETLAKRSVPALIIAADTIVVEPHRKKILGKPRSRAEAMKMLSSIQGATHEVLTAYCILEVGDRATHSLVRTVRSRVTMRPLSRTRIRAYVATGEPMDKAGAYAAQGIGMSLIERINGSYANVVGLPICQLLCDLEEQFEVRAFLMSRIPKVPAGVTVIAVSKTRSADEVEALYREGHRDFGENYVQELLEKARELESRGCKDIRWHFIGHLQTNKVKVLLPVVNAIHSVDSVKLAREISARASTRTIPVFLEINIDREASKSGFDRDDARAAAEEISRLAKIDVRGLMCIPSPGNPRASFAALRELEKFCHPFTQGELSMGMSDDFEAAISEGATVVRIGTRIFGPHPQKTT